MTALHLFQRLSEGVAWERELTRWARWSWSRSKRAVGGDWLGGLEISGVSQFRLEQLYNTMAGKRVEEWSYGKTTWEGETVALELILDGVPYRRSFDPELFHNRVKSEYIYPRVDDVQQGVLAYVTPGGDDGFQDTLQDFSDYEVLAGDATHRIVVLNNDGTTANGYLGEATNTLNPDDSIWVFQDLGRGLAGWNGDYSGKTPVTYQVSHVTLAGQRQETAWVEQVGSSDIYGESEYIDVLADSCYAAAAESARDKRLARNAYPRSFPFGGLSSDARSTDNRLSVTCAGYVFSMNRRFYETNDPPLNVSDQIETLVAASEFVTAGSILENDTIAVPLTGADISNLIWDNIEGLVNMGDVSGNRYRGGVRAGRVFDYDLAATDVLYQWKNGRLEYANGQPVEPTLIEPDILVRLDAPLVPKEPGAEDWNGGRSFYISEVEFIAPRSYRLTPAEGDFVLEGSA